MEDHYDAQYCFQDGNSSCRNDSLSTYFYITLYIFFSGISVVTVFLNLLVIISISHFKQLQTQTNLLILSLAVSDLLVGLIVIPASTVAIMEPCWDFGKYFCALFLYFTFLCTSSSFCMLLLISIDRYVAVCEPLLYHSKITPTRIKYYISIAWCCSIIYDAVYLKLSVNIQVPSRCFEECYFIEGDLWVNMFDVVVTMILPTSVIITLYLKIFLVARSQARKVFSKRAATVSGVKTVQANKSEKKAAKTLGIVILIFLICWIPIFFLKLIYTATGDSSSVFLFFVPIVNSFINPIIYALLYPWFRVTAKSILTLKFKQIIVSML